MSEIAKKSEKKSEPCRVCSGTPVRPLPSPVEMYGRCDRCGSVILDPRFFLSPDQERLRYLKHENSLSDPGYRGYLEAFLDGIFGYKAVAEDGIATVFDYGSGPEPALVDLLRQRGLTALGWDPFFNANGERFDSGADLVTCLEVAEHFHEPRDNFASLAGCIRPNGWVAVATRLVSGDLATVARDFPDWWYRRDPTHVVFYTREGLVIAAERAGLTYRGQCGPHTYLFRRE